MSEPAEHRYGFVLGLLPPFGLGAVAMAVGQAVPVLGAPVVGIVLGLLVGQIWGTPPLLARGVRFCSKMVLQASIVLLGAGMSLGRIAQIGWSGLPVMVGTIVVAVAAGYFLTGVFGLDRQSGALVTYGTTICGASAIATMSAVIGAQPAAVAVSIATIVLYNVTAAIVFPYLGQAMHLSPESFGLWAGTAVNDTSSVVAASTSYDALLLAVGIGGGVAASYAVVVKLTRTLAIIPLAIFQGHLMRRRHPEAVHGKPWWKLVPTFLVLFLVAAAVRTVGLIPDSWTPPLAFAAHYGTTVAMTAVGMSSSLTAIRKAGWRPLVLGGTLWVIVAVTSLVLQLVTGQLVTR